MFVHLELVVVGDCLGCLGRLGRGGRVHVEVGEIWQGAGLVLVHQVLVVGEVQETEIELYVR